MVQPISPDSKAYTSPQAGKPGALKVGIDASNIRLGGGVTHLIELLAAANPLDQGFIEVVVWGGTNTIDRLPSKPWLTKCIPKLLDGSLLSRVWWQIFCLSSAVRKARCDVLFVPGGSYAGNFHPVVTMSQNLLPFEWSELKRPGFAIATFKMLLLRIVQSWSFCRSEGVIFLTHYAQNAVLRVIGNLKAKTVVIAHGFSKPDPHVFRLLSARLQARGIAAGDTLMVGDRLDNDIAPARAQGWRTWQLGAASGGETGGDWAALGAFLARRS